MGYYRGDYYRGDPFLGALAARALPFAAKALKKVVPLITGRNLKRAAGAAATVGIAGPVLMGGGPRPPGRPPIRIGPIEVDPMAALPGGEPLFSRVPKERTYRRMNVLNAKALRRAIRRAEGFEKIARKTVNALRSGPKKFKSQSRKRS